MPEFVIRFGVVMASGSTVAVNLDGVLVPAWWAAGYTPTVGDKVRVILANGEATILGPYASTPQQPTGTIAGAPAAGLVPVTVGTATINARYIGTAPGVGTLVELLWQSTVPVVLGALATYTPPPTTAAPPAPAPPPTTTSGTATFGAIESGTFTNEWWSSDIRQGAYGSGTYHGAWFYGSAPAQMAGATVTGFRVRIGARLRIGSYNSAITVAIQRVAQASKSAASGGPTYTDTSTGLTLNPNDGAQWVALPASVGQNLVNAGGGGVGLSGATYGGVNGLDTDGSSGQIALDWQR